MSCYTYHAYGLTIRVPFACPALSPPHASCVGADHADVVVREQPVPRRLPAPQAGEASWDAAPGSFLLRAGRQAGRFLVEAGTVTFERNAECDDAILASYFTGQVLAALLRHRGLLVLHASALETPEGVIVIGGESGAGKSTALAALLDRGCRMLSDDVTAVRAGRGPRSAEVVPGVPQAHLTQHAAAGLGYTVHRSQLQPWHRMKAVISTRAGMAPRAGPLRAMYVLQPSRGDAVSVTEISGVDKLRVLMDCLYGPMFTEDHPALFPLMWTAVQAVPLLRLERPSARWSVREVADAVLAGIPELVP